MEDKDFKKPEDRYVLKRSGKTEKIDFRKIRERLERLAREHKAININLNAIIELVERSVVTGIRTSQLDRIAASASIMMGFIHPDYTKLAGAISVSNLHKETPSSFFQVMGHIATLTDAAGRDVGLLEPAFFQFISSNKEAIEAQIDHTRDFDLLSHDAILLLEKQYLLKDVSGVVRQRPQHMWMRVALSTHFPDLESAFEMYHDMSKGLYSLSSSVLMSAGCKNAMLMDSYNFCMGDSLDLIYETIRNSGLACSRGASVGVTVSDLRCAGSIIRKTNGTSTGLVPMLRVMNEVAATFNMGGRKSGQITVYAELWHNDIEKVLELKKKGGTEELRARDQDYAVMVSDLFMKRVMDDATWSFFCPDQCQQLTSLHGQEFEELYHKYESEGRARRTMPAKELWMKIITSITNNRSPKVIFKDAMNKMTNLYNPIKTAGSNGETAFSVSESMPGACPSASLSLPAFVNPLTCEFNFDLFNKAVITLVRALNKILDRSNYAPKSAAANASSQRPIAINVQGMADLTYLMEMPFDSKENLMFNQQLFQTLYFTALNESCTLAGQTEPVTVPNKLMTTKEGIKAESPVFLFEVFGKKVSEMKEPEKWEDLRQKIKENGVRNSVMISLSREMDTAVILGNYQGVEPIQGNLIPGKSMMESEQNGLIINRYLVEQLIREGDWNPQVQEQLLLSEGSLQDIDQLSAGFKAKYKTAWEMPQKAIMELAQMRMPYVCQSQSIAVSLSDREKIGAMLFWAWKKGIKTGLSHLYTEKPRISKGLLQQMRGLIQAAAGNDTLKMVRYMSPQQSESRRVSSQSCSLRRAANLGPDEPCFSCGS